MITNNFRIYLQGACAGATNSNISCKAIDGTTATSAFNTILSANNVKIILGSGDNTPAVTDYALETQINDLTQLSKGTEPNTSGEITTFDNTTCGIVTTSTFKNNTASDITVSELGVVGSALNNVLLIREVLDTPVVIEPNQSYSFTVTIG